MDGYPMAWWYDGSDVLLTRLARLLAAAISLVASLLTAPLGTQLSTLASTSGVAPLGITLSSF